MGAAASIAPDSSDRLTKLRICFDRLMQTEGYKDRAVAADKFDEFYSKPEHAILLLHLFTNMNLQHRCEEDSRSDFDTSSFLQIDVANARNEAAYSDNNDNDGLEDVSIVGECNNLSNLGFLATIPPQMALRVKCLNISNNKIEDGAVVCSSLSKFLPRLQYLQIGGNPLQSLMHVSGALPFAHLRLLDLSYSEGLVFDSNCFVNCPQVQSLVLDGCNIEDTIVSSRSRNASQSPSDSIFFGLISLVSLSLKENAIENVDKLRGLLFFGLNFMNQDEYLRKSASEIGLFTCPFRLKKVFLEENPICESGAGRRSVGDFLKSGIPSINYLDGTALNASATVAAATTGSGVASGGGGSIQLNKVLHRNDRSDDSDDLDPYRSKGLDNQEKEFLAALKGEKDNSVVS